MYNLRSNSKKKLDSPQDIPINNELSMKKNLKVILHTIPVLEDPANHDRTFYVLRHDIPDGKKELSRFLDKKIVLLFTMSLLCLMLFMLFAGSKTHKKGAEKAIIKLSHMLSDINLYTLDALLSLKSKIYGQNKFILVGKNNTNAPATTYKRKKKKGVCYNDVRDFVKNNFSEVKVRNGHPKTGKLSFIEEQCRIVTVIPKLADSLENSVNSSQKMLVVDSHTDYASLDSGAKILTTSSEPYVEYKINLGALHYIFGQSTITIDTLRLCKLNTALCRYFVSGPTNLLQPWKKTGECWSFRGSRGRVQIELSHRIYITSITLEHIPQSLVPNGNSKSAPKRFSVIGIDDSSGYKFTGKYPLGTYEYQLSEKNVQTFHLTKEHSSYPYKIIEFAVESNHGNEDYTCVYRLRVHGHV